MVYDLMMIRILFILAVIPGFMLLVYIYRLDKIEKEPVRLLVGLFASGVLAIIPAIIIELIGDGILGFLFPSGGTIYNFLNMYLVVAIAEEGSKMFFLRKISWKNEAFNFRFDAIVYAVCVGVGFAVFENIMYCFENGIGTAFARAITAVPAHTIFAIFMGHFYGQAKLATRLGHADKYRKYITLMFVVPVILHGTYDFLAVEGNILSVLCFLVFIVVLDIVAFIKIREFSRADIPV